MPIAARILAALVLTAFSGCQTAPAPDVSTTTPKVAPESGVHTVHVVSNGWHTGIVLARSDLSAGAIPETGDFPRARYFEFSWGDAKYFPAPEKTIRMAMGALLTPTAAVIHLAGLPAHPREIFPEAEIVDLTLHPGEFQDLLRYLDQSFLRPATSQSTPGLYRFSRFYPARGKFHMFNTCNTWTARGLAAAGIAVTVAGTLRAEDLMRQLR